ncbi:MULTISPECIES: S9 family peptidase [Paraburkholderia]|uniref:alpha/beta hydrolase family protein n=1 Tax=Paraburkholderia TaxID=1822464 RepID=UPI00224C945C|nr:MULTISPECIES: prolyl oligopeptidase family serine peptidase [Paraburkholderia]MCX4163622.1 prolyl oligopeptidase family serine peptidase [Paraburkholderia megapolitana]MDN7159117.1 prolyl oligopeptidase family serine peptidase [Paraburkholderia sp. CHISQ3]MDQ6496164.1 prolyl oligopeptidase family serine peptidase [Paraburkholderia megapolitana]
MLEYFPTNYVWNLSTNLALTMGANIGEVDSICRQIVEASTRGDDAGTEAFFNAWCKQADRLAELADEDLALDRRLSAGAKHGRASTYYLTAERMQHRDYAPRKIVYQKMLESFAKFVKLSEENCERVDIPYQGKTLAALFVKAVSQTGAPAPCIALFNGLDSTKEMIYGSGIQQALAHRGVSSISVDQPGVGEALRLHGLTAMVEAEVWASAVVDYLETWQDVDRQQIGVGAWSLGGYYAPRAAAMEKRFKLCVAWGANFNWGELQKRRLAREGDRPVPHYWEHVQWVWGKNTLEEFMAFAPNVTLAPVIDKITVPFLITHGAGDRQIPLEYAHQQYDGARNSPKRELKFFTSREGGVEHCSADNQDNPRDYIADWVAQTFGELGAKGVRT